MSDVGEKKSDLGVRTLSAIVMVAVAGAALWLGGEVFAAFVTLVAFGILWEITALVIKITTKAIAKIFCAILATLYVGVAVTTLVGLRSSAENGVFLAALPILLVAAIDIFAYFFGRTFGGPKIAPSISPSKTWAGLLGGMVGASAVMLIAQWGDDLSTTNWLFYNVMVGIGAAIVAQTGDFFQSWMKRKAGVKDSGKLIPGHGGLFDRTDGLIALLFTMAILRFVTT